MDLFGLMKTTARRKNKNVQIFYDDSGCMAVHMPSGQFAFGDALRDTYDNLLRTLGREGMRRPNGRQWHDYHRMGRFLWRISMF